MNSKVAIIDLGTNTFHLLIAEEQGGEYKIVHRERQAVKLGSGGINQGRIMADAIQRGVRALNDFKEIISTLGITSVHAFGTSAIRKAENKKDLLDQIKTETGIAVNVIDGEREAELIYYGVRSALDLGHEKSLIMDIGGGSVEFIIANGEKIFWKQSCEMGAQRLLEQFHKSDPIRQDEIISIGEYVQTLLKNVFDQINIHSPVTLVGSSGTFDTLSDIHCLRKNISKSEHDPETPLTKASFGEIYGELITKTRTQRMEIPGMIEMRVDMIVVACVLIRFIVDRFDFEGIRVSSYSLKEGVLALIAKHEM